MSTTCLDNRHVTFFFYLNYCLYGITIMAIREYFKFLPWKSIQTRSNMSDMAARGRCYGRVTRIKYTSYSRSCVYNMDVFRESIGHVRSLIRTYSACTCCYHYYYHNRRRRYYCTHGGVGHRARDTPAKQAAAWKMYAPYNICERAAAGCA